MSNKLYKTVTYVVTPGDPGVPSSPGSPGSPGYFYWGSETKCDYEGGIWVTPTGGSGELAGYEPPRVNIGGTYVCRSVPVRKYMPAMPAMPPVPGRPATPATIEARHNLGWNSGAISIKAFSLDGGFGFKVAPGAVGIVAGLNNASGGGGYEEIAHGFYCTMGLAQVIERGERIGTLIPFTAADEFVVRRKGSTISYYKGATLLRTSGSTVSGATFMDVSMYSANDYLFDPRIETADGVSGGGDGTVSTKLKTSGADPETLALWASSILMEPMSLVGYGPGVTATTVSNMSFEAMYVFSIPSGVTSSVLPDDIDPTVPGADKYSTAMLMRPMRVSGTFTGASLADGDVSLAPMTVAGGDSSGSGGSLIPSFALADIYAVPMRTDATSLTGEIGGGTVSFRNFFVLGSENPYAQADLELEAGVMWGESSPPSLDVMMRERMYSSGAVGSEFIAEMLLIGRMGVETELVEILVRDAQVLSSVEADGSFDPGALLSTLILTSAGVTAGVPVMSDAGEVWVVNDESSASAMYEDYSFNSFAKFDGKYYGAKSDGIYLLDGDTDDGQPVRSSVSFGRRDFGDSAKTSIHSCYIGVASDGTLVLKVTADGTEYLYRTTRTTGELATQRIKTGRGIKANYLTLELFNADGADFELDNIEFELAKLARRI